MMDRGLKIVVFCSRYGLGGGAEYMLRKMLLTLSGRGHDVTVFAIAKDVVGQTVEEGITVVHQPESYAREIFAALDRLRPDVVLCQWLRFSPSLIRWAEKAKVPVAVLTHNPCNWVIVANEALIEKVDLFIFNGPYLRDLTGRNVRQIVVTPPIETERILAPKRDPKHVTLVNLCKDKGAGVFYALAHRFPKKSFLGVEGGYGDQIKRVRCKNVTYLNHSADMRPAYGSTRVLLMPSKLETYGMAAVEAQANGIPVIAADIPALRHTLGNSALFVAPKNVAGWARALKRLDNAAFYARMSTRSRENARRNSFEQDMQELEFVLHDVVRRRRARVMPSVEGLLREYAALQAYTERVFRERVGREISKAELALVLESPRRPDEVLDDVIKEAARCTTRAAAVSA